MPNYSSSLLNSYSDIEHSNKFSPINNDGNFPRPQFSSAPQRQRTQERLHVDGLPNTNSNTIPNLPDFPHYRKHDQIRVCTINFCSLISHDKQLQLHQVIETYKPDVILGCETHLKEEISSNDIFPNEFLHPPPNRKDRASGDKGGVLIAIHCDIISIEQSSSADCEIVWTKISHNKGDIMFGSFYRQPTSPIETIEQLEVSMNNLKELNGLNSKHVILGGDFNLPDVNWTNGSIRSNTQYANEISEKMLGIMDEFNLKQVVQEPTRQNNILDLVFTTHPDLIEGTYVVPGMSDHSAVICEPPINPPRSVYLYKHADMEGLQEQLRNSYSSLQASQPSTKSVED